MDQRADPNVFLLQRIEEQTEIIANPVVLVIVMLGDVELKQVLHGMANRDSVRSLVKSRCFMWPYGPILNSPWVNARCRLEADVAEEFRIRPYLLVRDAQPTPGCCAMSFLWPPRQCKRTTRLPEPIAMPLCDRATAGHIADRPLSTPRRSCNIDFVRLVAKTHLMKQRRPD